MSITNGQPINVEQVAVRTASVTIKTITVDKRQMTLSMFRQLREVEPIDWGTGEWRGLPWGTVNYCPDKRCQKGFQSIYGHMHVVWQWGDELLRGTLNHPHTYSPGFIQDMLTERWRDLDALPQLFIGT